MRRELAATAGLLQKSFGLVLLNVVGIALLILAALAWLWISDSHVWEFLLSAVSGAVIVISAIWLQIVTMARWNRGPASDSIRLLKRLPAFLLWILVAWGACLLIGLFSSRQDLYAGYLASRPSQHVRYLLTYSRTFWFLGFVANIATYYFLPIVLLPLTSETAAHGLLHIRWRRYLSVLANWRFWLMQLLLVFVGVGAPIALLDWTPGKRLGTQVVSVGLRLALEYLLAIGAWLVSVAFVGVLLSGEGNADARVAGADGQPALGALTEGG